MRILVDYRPALRARTGVGEYVHELVAALSRTADASADEVAVFTASWRDRPDPDLSSQLPGVRSVHRRLPARWLTWSWNRLGWPPIDWLAGGYDVIHAATPVAIPGRAPAVLTIHDLHFLRHPERMTAEMRRDYPTLVPLHARAAPAIVVSSAYTATDLASTLGVDTSRIHLCPPGPPPWAPEVLAHRQGGDATHILFLGTLEPRKNVGVLLDAYSLLRSQLGPVPPLVLAGGVREDARAWVERSEREPLRGHVRVTGYVSHRDRMGLLAAARMLVLPSIDEGFGLPVLEAMACGVPVVISSGGSLPEVAGDAATPVDPADVDGLAQQMATLLDPDAAAEASRRGLARAATFSWARCATLVRRAYAAALERRG